MSDLFLIPPQFGFIDQNTIRINLLDEKQPYGVQYGLNWAFDPETGELRIEKGKTESSRSGNESYFQLPKEIYQSDFFPEEGIFHVIDDLGNDFVFSRSQPKVKDGKPQALSTPESNKILGLYIRHRLGLKSGSLIQKECLVKYGRTDIIFKKNIDGFLMDFSTNAETADSSSAKSLQCVKIPLDITSENDKKLIKQNLIMRLNEIESTDKDEGFSLLSQLVMFGIQNGKLISENSISLNELASESNISDNYHQHLRFGVQIYNYAKNSKWIETLEQSNFQSENQSLISPTATPHTSPEQIIFYGVPGSGKSHEIKQKLETEYNIPEAKQDIFVERTVFHPEYTNADFIGQIMPKLVQGKTDFVFKPGPFTSILKKALSDSQNRYVLIIEEINRGNAAAIFGELFQLLDRIDDESKQTYHENELNVYGKGWSEYFVMNSEINNYIRNSDDSFDGNALDLNGIHFSANTGIRLPPNLSILATMNTSDQNVFTLDNAFQRRWNMKLIENVFGDTDKENSQKGAFVDTAKTITWEKFQKAINIKIGKMSDEAGLSSMEDKRIGCWFVKATRLGNDYIIPKDLFAEKVLKYLWDDAFKFCREKVFNGYTNLESLTRDFKHDKEFFVFKDLFSEIEN